MVDMVGNFHWTTENPAGATVSNAGKADAYCMVCFDVKKEDADLEEGHQGIGQCVYDDAEDDDDWYYDADFFGTVEATGSGAFKFLDDKHNDWDTDSGYLGMTSSIGFSSSSFISEPLDVNSNSAKNLGIKKGKTYWKCYIGQDDAPDTKDPFNHEFSLDKFTTDKPRRIDTSTIADSASRILIGLVSLIGMLELIF